jgi:phenylpropionate dioxygenase-like ring-hydroxylating dioxygenase large terminal subunit
MSDAALQGLWYLAGLSREVKPGAMLRRVLFGEPVVLGRTGAGAAFALRDVCPHRAAPLSAGRVSGEAVTCPYHAWSFSAADGRCVSVPALPSDDARDPSTIRVARYALAEANGLIWIWYGAGEPMLVAPDIGLPPSFKPKTATIVETSGPFDEAVVGLVDPAHTPTVHKQWWWRDGRPRADKAKAFAPAPLGFKMTAHAPSSNSLIYKAIGGAPVTEIEFRLPALRLEHIRTKDRRVLALTAMTPGEAGTTRIVHLNFWNFALFDALQPFAQGMADSFLKQDGDILRLQNENLSRARHRALYLGDADEPAKWYFALKKAWAEKGEAAFVNPLAPATLRWRT